MHSFEFSKAMATATATASSGVRIPNEIVMEILMRSPPEFLLRFKSTCKLWHSVINDPSFFAKYHAHSSLRCHSRLLHLPSSFLGVSTDQRFWTLLSEVGPFLVEHSKIRIPFETITGSFSLVGSCNGVLCLTDTGSHFGRVLYLWNPSCGIHKTIFGSSMPHALGYRCSRVVLGFGFYDTTSSADDYKIVRVMYRLNEKTKVLTGAPPQVEVYSLKSDSWVFFGSIVQNLIEQNSQAFVHGAIHWLASRPGAGQQDYDSIVLFDVAREEFKVMSLPDDVTERNNNGNRIGKHAMCLKEFQGSLAVVVLSPRPLTLSVWVMEDYGFSESWMQRVVVPRSVLIRKKFLGFTEKGKVLLGNKGSQLTVWNPKNQQMQTIVGLCEESIPIFVVPYMDSFVLFASETAKARQVNPIQGVTNRGTELVISEDEETTEVKDEKGLIQFL